ncbi:hypothetical protein DPMN_140991 [Dreissena polymorpha]|uniref:Uncharacterized protein n=1 Tax=Dreissena polymorpha TaxID=45954 RepID=A0A9D4JH64_DREPO|nr:hypothetical protein DPMN_140991 [Dreissena polymorpha]
MFAESFSSCIIHGRIDGKTSESFLYQMDATSQPFCRSFSGVNMQHVLLTLKRHLKAELDYPKFKAEHI